MRVRDLGVTLDAKLTFADHVDATVAKANRMLGMLIRSMQVSASAHRMRFDHVAVLAAYKTHVRWPTVEMVVCSIRSYFHV